MGGTMISLDKINLEGSTQMREQLDKAAIADYKYSMEEGVRFPPVELMHDGLDYWVIDGFHRILAANQTGLMELNANVRNGTQRDAILASCQANATHGVQRTNEDKRKAVTTLLSDEEWNQWSDRAIAEACGVSNTMVSKYRPQLSTVDSSTKTTGKDGKERKRPEPKPETNPEVITDDEPDSTCEQPEDSIVQPPTVHKKTRQEAGSEETEAGFSMLTYRRELESEVRGVIEIEDANQYVIGQTLVDLGNELMEELEG